MSKKKSPKKAAKIKARKSPTIAKIKAAARALDAAPGPTKITMLSDVTLLSLTHAQLYPSPLNPRTTRDKDADKALADSIVAQGILEPLMARPNGGKWEIIMGDRRWTAVGIAIKDGRLTKDYQLPVRERSCTDAELVEMAAAENMGRADMHPLDEAAAIQAMRKFHKDDAEIIRRLGVPERTFYRRAALLRLADEVRDLVKAGKLSLQQAAAFTLGKPAEQVAHLAKMKTGNYYADVAAIRRAMTEKRIPVQRAIFPREQYDGEILTDQDAGQQYFANAKLFNELQDAAIAAKVKQLRKEYAWVKEVDAHERRSYGPAKKGHKGAGAIYGTGNDGTFFVSAPVVLIKDDGAVAPREAAPAREPTKKEMGRQETVSKVFDVLMADPRGTLAAQLSESLVQEGFYLQGDGPHAERQRRILTEMLPLIGDNVKVSTIQGLAEWLTEAGEVEGRNLYRALAALSEHDLLRLAAMYFAPLVANSLCVDGQGAYTLLGLEVMQRELPLAGAAGKEAA